MDSQSYVNVMEDIVAQEVRGQLSKMPQWIRQSRKLEEVSAYALNRLPTLYASSQKGWKHQHEFAQRELKHQIKEVVREAVLNTHPDFQRYLEPLSSEHLPPQESVLQVLGKLFHTPELTWPIALVKLKYLKQQPGNLEQKLTALVPGWQGTEPAGVMSSPESRNIRKDLWDTVNCL